MPSRRSTTQKPRRSTSATRQLEQVDLKYAQCSEGGEGHWQPKPHHLVGVKWLIKHPEALLFLEPGLGKTTIALSAYKAMLAAKGSKKALVIAPKRVAQLVWTHDEGGELYEWAGSFGDLRVTLLHGTDKDERLEEDADLYVINPDGLQWLTACEACGHSHTTKCGYKPANGDPCECRRSVNERITQLFDRGLDTLIVDELSKFKHADSKRFKVLKPHLRKFKRRWGMTGSPAANGLLDLFGQAYVIDLGKALGTYITHYRHTFFVPSGFGGYTWRPQKGAEERIYKQLEPIAISMKAADHLDLPELIEQNIWVNLPDKQRKVYEDLEEELVAYLDTGAVTAANAAVASGKCRQVASGGLYVDEINAVDEVTRKVVHLHDEKTEALVELIEELQGSPLLVIYEFHHDLERIKRALGKDTPAINGQTPDKLTAQYAQQWNRGELPVLCGHPAAMGHGLNLQKSGHHIVHYSLTWDLELYDQVNRRLYRQGQKNRVFVHRVLARKTVDETVAKVISTKQRGQNALFDALKTELRKRRKGS